LKGEFALFKLKGNEKGEKSWILMKKNDEHATEEDVKLQNKSVKSGKTLAQVAEANGAVVKHPEEDVQPKTKTNPVQLLSTPSKAASKKRPAGKKTASKKTASKKKPGKKVNVKELLGEHFHLARKAAMPQDVIPMLATLIDEPFDNENWIYEIKWDGYRAVAYCNDDSVELISRNLKPFTEKYGPVTGALAEQGLSAVFDGEIVAVDENGLANFQLLQNWQNTASKLQFFIFDIIWLEGYDITSIPLIERKRILNEILPDDHDIIKYSDHVVGSGKDFFKVALSQGLEGIMAKKAASIYKIDERSEDWVKIKVNLRQEVIITGYTQPRNTRQFFGSLLLGVYHEGELKYIGHTGSGFNKKLLESIYNKLQPLVINECPFEKCPKGNMPVTWVKPKLVCEIKFTEWTKDWMARHPIFMGLRTDKKAKDVIIEKAKNMAVEKRRRLKKQLLKLRLKKKAR
jgi:bifunctional non-homologous end joining protein LigD